MATIEKASTANPIRLRLHSSRGNGADDITGLKVFKNQVPGTVVLDLLGDFYLCTKWKTSKGEPVWAEIDPASGTNTQNYAVYVRLSGARNTTSRYSRTSQNTITTDPAIISRLDQSAYNVHVLGNYFFQALSSSEKEKIIAEPNYSIGTFFYSEQKDVDDFPSMVMRSLQSINEKYDYMRTDSNGRSGPGSTPDSLEANANEEYEDRVTKGMTEGNQPLWWSREAAEARHAAVDSKVKSGFFGVTGSESGSGSGSGSGSSGSSGSKNSNTKGGAKKPTKGKPVPKSTTTVILKPDQKTYTGSNDFGLPYMKQVINHFSAAENSRQRIERIHVFEMIPNSFEFSQLSSTWNEVARSGNYPLVDWSNYNLTKVSFRFLVVAKKLEQNQFFTVNPTTKVKTLTNQTSSIVNDGLLISIDEQLDNIRAMIGAPAPVTLYNLNSLLSTEYRYPYTNNARNIQWIVAESSITATRLTQDGKAISAAEVSLTLTEYPVIAREIIPLPPLTPDNPPPPPCKPDSGDPKCTPVDPVLGLWVGNTYKYLSYIKDAVSYPTGNANG